MFESLLKSIFGSKHDRDVQRARPIVAEVNDFGEAMRALSDDDLKAKTPEFRARLVEAQAGIEDLAERRTAEREMLDEILPEAFAVVREVCRRMVGKTWDVVGIPTRWDMVQYDVQVIGAMMLHEGKIAEMATGEGKTLAATMPIYLNGLTGRGAHLVTVNDYLARRDSEWMGEVYRFLGLTVGCIQQGMEPVERRAQYACDITYGTNNEFGFDYLRDNMSVRPEHRVQRGFFYAIVDEVDSVLVDEARTPLIISGPVEHSEQAYDELKPLIERVIKAQTDWANRVLPEAEELLKDPKKEFEAGVKLLQIQRATPKNKRFLKLIADQPGLKKLISRVEGEFLRDKRMHELDEDLFFAIEERHHSVDLLEKGRALMSPGDPELFVVPDLAGQLSELEGDDSLPAEDKIARRDTIYQTFAVKNERIHSANALLKAYSLFERDVEYIVQDGKVMIVDEHTGRLMPGRRYSDGLHQAIEAKESVRVEGETQTLATITLQNFFRMYEKLAGMTGTAETESREFWEIYKLDVSVIPTHRNVVRKDENDVVYRTKREKLNAVVEEIADCHKRGQPVLVGTISVEVSELLSRMLKRRGIKHNVLNAKFHQQEAEIVASAGQREAVTIATNMAGRGTDIKLGEGVAGLGGLHILGTERHESRRIDRQLRGRAGRQGDPGSSRFFLSLEDNLMRLFGSERIAGLMERMGVEEGEVIEHPLVTRAIGRAQKRVEAYNFDIRKHLLEYDSVMNVQRNEIYRLRDQMLLGTDASELVRDTIAEAIEERVGKHAGAALNREDWNLKGLAEELSFLMMTPITLEEIQTEDYAELVDKALALGEKAYQSREAEFTPEVLRELERHLYLYTLDEHWRDHLYELDGLKSGIGLRAYGQRDPLIEYKKEAFTLYATLLSEVRDDYVMRLFRVHLEAQAVREIEQRPRPRRMVERHPEVDAFANAPLPEDDGSGEEPRSAPPPQQVAPVRSVPRAGRNDPCPCGSGKKYKKCHMPLDEGAEE